MIDEHEVRLAIYPVQDPELQMSIVDLGLIYGVRVLDEGKKVEVDMTLTSIACPIGPQLRAAVHGAVAQMPGVEETHVNLVFSPPWDPRTMASEDAQMNLGLL
jgi:metal-sulfur cluster biosynthetic enzyme